jgi:alkylated DNA repair dioxygenase AlkB
MIPKELEEDFEYIEFFFSEEDSKIFFNKLINEIDWEEKEITLFGKTYMQPRLIKWFGEKDYTYSNKRFEREEVPDLIKKIQQKVERKINHEFNSVLLNYYRAGDDSMGKHSDDEKELGIKPLIVSISFGVQRDFVIQEKIGEKKRHVINLQSGSLLVMRNNAQKLYSHELPKRKKVNEGRINITFRRVY